MHYVCLVIRQKCKFLFTHYRNVFFALRFFCALQFGGIVSIATKKIPKSFLEIVFVAFDRRQNDFLLFWFMIKRKSAKWVRKEGECVCICCCYCCCCCCCSCSGDRFEVEQKLFFVFWSLIVQVASVGSGLCAWKKRKRRKMNKWTKN